MANKSATFDMDLTEYNERINKLYNMGELRRRDIAEVFRKANRPLIQAAKANAARGKRDVVSIKVPGRSHTKGNLKRGIGFKVGKPKYGQFVYWVRSKAYYSYMYAKGHGKWQGSDFFKKAIDQNEASVTAAIKEGLSRLILKQWQNG